MRGHIRERSPGHWAIILEQRDSSTGKRKRKWHSFEGTKREAQVECARLISQMKGGTYLEPAKTTVAQFLDRWLDHTRSQVSPRSHERYCELARKNISPLLGAVFLVTCDRRRYQPPIPRPSPKAGATVAADYRLAASIICTAF